MTTVGFFISETMGSLTDDCSFLPLRICWANEKPSRCETLTEEHKVLPKCRHSGQSHLSLCMNTNAILYKNYWLSWLNLTHYLKDICLTSKLFLLLKQILYPVNLAKPSIIWLLKGLRFLCLFYWGAPRTCWSHIIIRCMNDMIKMQRWIHPLAEKWLFS